MVVGMDRALAAARAGEQLIGAPGDHLIGVHVGLRARAGLPDDKRELVVVLSFRHFPGRSYDGVGRHFIQTAVAGVHPCSAQLHQPERMDERKRHALPPYREIAGGSLSMRAPIGGGRYVARHEAERKSTRLNSRHECATRTPSY